jgi:hypothetical protein
MMQAQTTDTLPSTNIVSVAPLSKQRKANSYFFGYDFPFTISFLTDENILNPQQITMIFYRKPICYTLLMNYLQAVHHLQVSLEI